MPEMPERFAAFLRGIVARPGEYLDMCNHCFSEIAYDVDTIVREDLREDETLDEDEDYEDEEV